MSESPVVRGGDEIRQKSKEFCMPLKQTSQFYYGGVDSIAKRLVDDRMLGAKVSKSDRAEALVRVAGGCKLSSLVVLTVKLRPPGCLSQRVALKKVANVAVDYVSKTLSIKLYIIMVFNNLWTLPKIMQLISDYS